jgi:hypothetical protein
MFAATKMQFPKLNDGSFRHCNICPDHGALCIKLCRHAGEMFNGRKIETGRNDVTVNCISAYDFQERLSRVRPYIKTETLLDGTCGFRFEAQDEG